MKLLEFEEDRRGTYDCANVPRDVFHQGLSEFYSGQIPRDEVHDIALAETVRIYVTKDLASLAPHVPTREFTAKELMLTFPFWNEREYFEDIFLSLEERGLIASVVPEENLEAAHGGYFLTSQGLHRGLALIEKYLPRRRFPKGTIVVDSSRWTGVMKTPIRESNRQLIGKLIDNAIALIDESVTDNEKHSQAIGYLRAAAVLVETPDPPSNQIWDFIYRAAAICGLASSLLTLFIEALDGQ